jgi:transposase
MYYLGIDWATDKHDVCLLAADGRILSEFAITHDLKGFESLHQLLKMFEPIRINIERSDGLLVDWIISQGYALYVTPPYAMAQRRTRRSKSDRADAYQLANMLRNGEEDCRPFSQQSALVIHLKQLVRAHDHAAREQRRLANQLIYELRMYYPAAIGLFKKVHSLISLAFLEFCPTPQAAQALTREGLEAFLLSHNYKHRGRLEILYNTLQTPMPTATVQDGHIEYVLMLIPLLRCLFERKRDLQKQIVTVFNRHPEAGWWKSFPGTKGPLTPARLLAWIGDDHERFPSANVLQAMAGTVPITRSSNKRTTILFRQACCHPLRKAAMDLARQSMRTSGWARAYFNEQRARGHAVPRAMRALANRWLKIIWTLWQSGEMYDEAVHLGNRARRGQPGELEAAAD